MTATEILEYEGLENTHWGKRIMLAEKYGCFTERDVEKAGVWTTCACGMQDDRIPRSQSGTPEDGNLESYGSNFYYHVKNHRVWEAAEELAKIEQRAFEVLAELGFDRLNK